MKQNCALLLCLFLFASLAACSSGHLGSNELAFIRDGHLWTIDPDGANAFEIVAQDTHVIEYSWSPNHQLLVFRTLDEQFAKTSAAKQLVADPLTGQLGDAPTNVNTIGIDGGSPIPIMLSAPGIQYSNPIWNSTGTRLVYRQEPTTTPHVPGNALWWASQNDQPGGIASKILPGSDARLSLSYIDSSAIGNTGRGIFTVSLTGTNMRYLLSEPRADALPASLERVLWQPAHSHPAILYAIPQTTKNSGKSSPMVQLMLYALNGQRTTLATCACTQFAWSPDGNIVLYSTASKYSLINVNDKSSFDIVANADSVPYWSPDSQFLLLDGTHTLELIHVADKQQSILLSDTTEASNASSIATRALASVNALLQPVPNSLWASDSRHFLFLTRNRLIWQGHPLSSGKGLYAVTIDAHGQPQGAPVVVDIGNDTQAGWTYQDANTSFLY